METLHIKGEDDTPEIVFDKENGIFKISGRSLPEDVVEFYKPVLEWIDNYKLAPNANTEVTLKVEYLNTASSKLIQDVLMSFEKIQGSKVVWYYREDDDDMDGMGHEYAEIIELPFEFKSYK
jgi:hypothetical protein